MPTYLIRITELLATGECSTIREAAEVEGVTLTAADVRTIRNLLRDGGF